MVKKGGGKEYELSIIPQLTTEYEIKEKYPNTHIISMNTEDYKSVIDQIVLSKLVVSSSLHGIILSDAYGIPSVFYRGLSKNIDFKYLDYYASTGRNKIKIADTIEDALLMKPLLLPDLKPLQDGLLKVFPYDLWNL